MQDKVEQYNEALKNFQNSAQPIMNFLMARNNEDTNSETDSDDSTSINSEDEYHPRETVELDKVNAEFCTLTANDIDTLQKRTHYSRLDQFKDIRDKLDVGRATLQNIGVHILTMTNEKRSTFSTPGKI